MKRPGNRKSAIEDMDQLLDHIHSFEQDLSKSSGLVDPSISQEYSLFIEYLSNRIHDMQQTATADLHQLTHPDSEF